MRICPEEMIERIPPKALDCWDPSQLSMGGAAVGAPMFPVGHAHLPRSATLMIGATRMFFRGRFGDIDAPSVMHLRYRLPSLLRPDSSVV